MITPDFQKICKKENQLLTKQMIIIIICIHEQKNFPICSTLWI